MAKLVPSSLILKRHTGAFLTAIVVLFVGVGASFVDSSTQRLIVTTMIMILFVVGLYVFVGLSGVLSFGHIGFAAVGAYAGALVTMDPTLKGFILPDLPPILSSLNMGPLGGVLVGAGAAALVASLVALPLTRLSGLAAGLASFAFLEIIHTTTRAAESVTGGSSGLSGLPITTTAMSASIAVAIACILTSLYQHSRWGLALRASRGDATAAASVGIDVRQQRAIALVFSAAIMGAGGALYVSFLGVIGTDMFYLALTFLVLTMLVVGGMTSLVAAVGGAILLSLLAEMIGRAQNEAIAGIQLPAWAGINDIVLATLLLLVLFFRPAGLFIRKQGGGKSNYLRLPSFGKKQPNSLPLQETTPT